MVERHADLVLVGARIEAITPRSTPANAVAIRDGRIVAVGVRADVRPLIGTRTEVVELRGETLLPGFGDAHVHPIDGGMLADRCNLHDLADAPAYLEAIARYASDHPERHWILGGGWSLSAFPRGEPPRELLDAVIGQRPAFLESNDGHVAWASSLALELAGISAETPDPPDGRIVRDARGVPAGTLVDGATALVTPYLPAAGHGDWVRWLRAGQAQLHRWGITAWQDAHVEPAQLAAYREGAEAGWLTARVVAALWWERAAGLEQIEAFERLRTEAEIGRLRAGSVKLMLDGILESGTALLTSPYLGTDGEAGAPFIEPELLREAVVELDRRGFQAHFHAVGDGAARLALDAVEEARRCNAASDARHHVAHLELLHPDDLPRFSGLGVTANIQPFWAVDDDQMRDLRLPVLGPQRNAWQFVFGSLRRAGARLAGGSDWTVTTANPLLEMEVAVRRVSPDARDAEPFLPNERLTLDEALAAFTIGTAYVNHLDHETGSIEVGKLADLVLLDRDIRAPDAGPLGEARVRATWVEGEAVYVA